MLRVTKLLLPLLIVVSAAGQTGPEIEMMALVSKFLTAEKAYDSASLAKLISPEFVEISPAGEVDAHDRFLSFYAADKKVDWPPMTLSDDQVRVFGDTAIEIVKVSYTMQGADGKPRPLEIRSMFTAQCKNGEWKSIGAQHTGIRPVPAPK